MADQWQGLPPVVYPNFGGWDSTSAPSQVAITDLTQLDNAFFGPRKTWKKRGGLVAQNSVPMSGTTDVQYLVDYWKAGSSGAPTQDLFAYSGNKFFKDDGDNTWDDVSGTISIPSGSAVTTCVVGDQLVIASSATIPYVYDQTGNVTALSGTPPIGDLTAEHLSRCWMNTRNDPHKLNYTGPTATGEGDPTRWSVANGGGGFYIEPDDGDPVGITALFKHQDVLYAAKKTKIYRIEGRTSDTFRPVRVVNGLGCVSQNMVVPVGGDVLFPSMEGFHSLAVVMSGNLDPSAYLSRDIHKTYHADTNVGRLRFGHGKYYPELRAVVWAVPLSGQSQNMVALVYSLSTRRWSRFTNFRCNALMTRYNSTTQKIELWTGGNTGIVYKYTPTTLADYGTYAIDMRLKSGHIYPSRVFSEQFGFKYFNLLLHPLGNHDYTFNYRVMGVVDSSSVPISSTVTRSQGPSGAYTPLGSAFILGTALLGEESLTEPHAIELMGSGKSFEWELLNNTINEDLEIAGWQLEADPESKVRRRVS